MGRLPIVGRVAGVILSCAVACSLAARQYVGHQTISPASLYEKKIPLFDLLTQGDVGQGLPITEISQREKKRQLIKDKWVRDLVRKGFVVLAPELLTAGERIYPGRDVYDTRPIYQTHRHWSMMGKMIWDHMRSVDVLQSLSFVDPKKIGAVGWSLGGHNAGFLAAFDDRIAVTVSDGGMTIIAGDADPFGWCRQEDTDGAGVVGQRGSEVVNRGGAPALRGLCSAGVPTRALS